ncbi:MAG TPA: hypothetical protein VFW62_03095 [bacterium]|nr:hypothetical protein [bacterium]
MGIGEAIYQAINYLWDSVSPPAPPPTAEELEQAANDACWQDVYSEPCARLSDLAEQAGGINVRRELVNLDALIRPMLNKMLAEQEQNGGYCSSGGQGEINYTPSCFSPEIGCYTALQCSEDSSDPTGQSLKIFIVPESLPQALAAPIY